MVLEEATANEEPSFSESLPSNDVDPYAGDRDPTYLSTRESSYVAVNPPGTQQVYVNLNNLPKPFTFFGSSSHQKILSKALQDSCRAASQILGRPVRQEEADALGYHFARSIKIGSYGSPIGISVAAIRAYRGMSNYDFPFWKPGEKFNKDRLLFLRGQRARIMWQVLRFNAWAFAGAFVGQVLFGSYALTAGSAGRMMDPRLKELSEKIRERSKRGQNAELLPGGREYDTTAGPREGETLDMSRQRQRVQQPVRQRTRQGVQQGQADDMSPTGGSFGEDFMDVAGGGGDTGIMSDSQAQVSAYKKDQEGTERFNQSRAEDVRRSTPRLQEPDDASPMAQADSASSTTGSAWERLRQQASSGAQQQSSPTSSSRRGTSSGGDSFSFSQGEEDKQLARAEAQKQFDARIEREREGKDFTEQQAGRGSWRS